MTVALDVATLRAHRVAEREDPDYGHYVADDAALLRGGSAARARAERSAKLDARRGSRVQPRQVIAPEHFDAAHDAAQRVAALRKGASYQRGDTWELMFVRGGSGRAMPSTLDAPSFRDVAHTPDALDALDALDVASECLYVAEGPPERVRLDPGTDDVTALANLGRLLFGERGRTTLDARGRLVLRRKPFAFSRSADPRAKWEPEPGEESAFEAVCAAHERLAALPVEDARVLDLYAVRGVSVPGLATTLGIDLPAAWDALAVAWQCYGQAGPEAPAMSLPEADELVAYLDGPTRAAQLAGISRTALANRRQRGYVPDDHAKLLRFAGVTRSCTFLSPTKREGTVAALTSAQAFLDNEPSHAWLSSHALQLVQRAWSLGPNATAFAALRSFAEEEFCAA